MGAEPGCLVSTTTGSRRAPFLRNATNLRCLCRKHHNMKSHDRLPEKFIAPAVEHRERWRLPSPVVIEFDLYPAA
jgi:hypothetical protein